MLVADNGENAEQPESIEDVRFYLDGEFLHVTDQQVQRLIDGFPRKGAMWVADMVRLVAPPECGSPAEQ